MKLDAFLFDRPVGVFERTASGTKFTYDAEWIRSAGRGEAMPLSISMPITRYDHGADVAGPFLDGLVSENVATHMALEKSLSLTPGADALEILSRIGRDCAGAVSFINRDDPYQRVRHAPRFKVLSPHQLAATFRSLPSHPFGASEEVKTVLSGDGNKLPVIMAGGTPSVSIHGFPTSHILKIDRPGMKDEIKVEFFCLKLAEAVGLKTPPAKVDTVEDISYLVLSRFDRRQHTRTDGKAALLRVHQEDICQATGTPSAKKYEASGGPGWGRFASLAKLTRQPAIALADIVDRATFSYVINHRDGHAKNQALRYASNGAIELAPVYDLGNAAAFAAIGVSQRSSWAMEIGVDRKAGAQSARGEITSDHWAGFAVDIGMPAVYVATRLKEVAARIESVVPELRERLRGTPADSPMLDIAALDVLSRAQAVMQDRPIIDAAPSVRQPGVDVSKHPALGSGVGPLR